MQIIPTVSTENGKAMSDLISELMRQRIVFISGEINNDTADLVTAQLLYLEAQAPEKPVSIYIDSPGGSVSAGLAIYDTMKMLFCDVITVCTGMAASMGSFLLAGGTAGKRYVLPNSEVMIHQPLGGAYGQAADVEIMAKHVIETKHKLNQILSENTGRTLEEIEAATDRDNFMNASQAIEFGIADHIMDRSMRETLRNR